MPCHTSALWHQFHSTFWTIAWLIAHYFRMHGAGVSDGFVCVRFHIICFKVCIYNTFLKFFLLFIRIFSPIDFCSFTFSFYLILQVDFVVQSPRNSLHAALHSEKRNRAKNAQQHHSHVNQRQSSQHRMFRLL